LAQQNLDVELDKQVKLELKALRKSIRRGRKKAVAPPPPKPFQPTQKGKKGEIIEVIDLTIQPLGNTQEQKKKEREEKKRHMRERVREMKLQMKKKAEDDDLSKSLTALNLNGGEEPPSKGDTVTPVEDDNDCMILGDEEKLSEVNEKDFETHDAFIVEDGGKGFLLVGSDYWEGGERKERITKEQGSDCSILEDEIEEVDVVEEVSEGDITLESESMEDSDDEIESFSESEYDNFVVNDMIENEENENASWEEDEEKDHGVLSFSDSEDDDNFNLIGEEENGEREEQEQIQPLSPTPSIEENEGDVIIGNDHLLSLFKGRDFNTFFASPSANKENKRNLALNV